jgi:hypothetical protein
LVSKRSVSSSFLYPLQKEIARGKTGLINPSNGLIFFQGVYLELKVISVLRWEDLGQDCHMALLIHSLITNAMQLGKIIFVLT